MLDRFNIGTVALDHRRSLDIYGRNKPDTAAQTILYGLPIAAAAASVWLRWNLTAPTALLPAVALLSGVLLAVSGQVISLRARVADSVVLSANRRLAGMFREAISGVILAASAALIASLLLGALAIAPVAVEPRLFVPPQPLSSFETGLRVGLTATFAGVGTFLVLLFLSSARRLYQAYLEAFEDGHSLSKPDRSPKTDPTNEDLELPEDRVSNDALDAAGIPSDSGDPR